MVQLTLVLNKYTRTSRARTKCRACVGTAARGWAQICIHPPTKSVPSVFVVTIALETASMASATADGTNIGARWVEFEEWEDSEGGCALKNVGERGIEGLTDVPNREACGSCDRWNPL
jgi:hypothetical protein